jgi:hypothetical protein
VLVFVHLVLRQYQVGLVRLVCGGLPEQLVLSRGDHCKAKINHYYLGEKIIDNLTGIILNFFLKKIHILIPNPKMHFN